MFLVLITRLLHGCEHLNLSSSAVLRTWETYLYTTTTAITIAQMTSVIPIAFKKLL